MDQFDEKAREIFRKLEQLHPVRKPSIDELANVLAQPDDRYSVKINVDGTVDVVDNLAVEIIAAALREAAREENEACAAAVCDGCRLGLIVDKAGRHAEPLPIKCQAAAIRARKP